jgi:DNA-binding transcriptional regulator YiaG
MNVTKNKARGYSKATIARVMESTEDSISMRLAKACIRANLPSSEIAEHLNVTRASLNAWFKGTVIRGEKAGAAHKLTEIIIRDLELGVLPAKDRESGIDYLRSLTVS